MREQEIRNTTGKAQADAEFLKALESDDLETARALLDAPGGSMIADEIRRRGEEAYAKRTNPDGWDKMQYIEFLRENLSVLSQQVAQWLKHLGASVEAIQGVVTPKE